MPASRSVWRWGGARPSAKASAPHLSEDDLVALPVGSLRSWLRGHQHDVVALGRRGGSGGEPRGSRGPSAHPRPSTPRGLSASALPVFSAHPDCCPHAQRCCHPGSGRGLSLTQPVSGQLRAGLEDIARKVCGLRLPTRESGAHRDLDVGVGERAALWACPVGQGVPQPPAVGRHLRRGTSTSQAGSSGCALTTREGPGLWRPVHLGNRPSLAPQPHARRDAERLPFRVGAPVPPGLKSSQRASSRFSLQELPTKGEGGGSDRRGSVKASGVLSRGGLRVASGLASCVGGLCLPGSHLPLAVNDPWLSKQ